MNCTVDHESSMVEKTTFTLTAASDHFAVVIDMYEVAGVYHGERYSEFVDPKRGGINWITNGDMAGDTFIEAVFAEDPQGQGESSFQISPLFIFICEFGWFWKAK